ncbi:MAG TPA: hypothetical protein ENF34_04165 [Candidatus Bathyarchaeota archaeon]|nr:hypothetical protein [Candidatus Bathyarchaeota archaeon]
MGTGIYYYLAPPRSFIAPRARARVVTRAEEKLFLTIRDEEAVDPRFTGGKGAGLAKIYRAIAELKAKGLPVDVPFAVILGPPFVRRLLSSDPRILEKVRALEEALSRGEEVGPLLAEIRELIMGLEFPRELEEALDEAVELLREEGLKAGKEEPIRVAVRSSGLAEDLPTASFAGQYETILNVRLSDREELKKAILECLASIYGDRVTDYRQKLRERGLKIPSEVEICSRGLFSIILQLMVDSEWSGVGFSIETESGHPRVFKSTAWLGLGELGVQGKVPTAEIFAAKIGEKRPIEVFGKKVTSPVVCLGVNPPSKPQREMLKWDPEEGKNVIVEVKEPINPRIANDAQALLVSLAVEHLEREVGKGKPVDVEFAWEKGRLYLLQVRPETVHAVKSRAVIESYVLEEEPPEDALLGVGLNVGTKIASGPLMPLIFGDLPTEELSFRIRLLKRILREFVGKFNAKPIIYTSITSPPWEPVMKRDLLSGIVTELGNRTSHPAIISREEGLACSVGTKGLSERLGELRDLYWGVACTNCDFCSVGRVDEPAPERCPSCGAELFKVVAKEPVTLDCTKGEARIYRGALKFRVEVREIRELPRPETKVAVNCGSPMEALNVSLIPGVSKVGLAREEFIAAWIQVHPVFCIKASEVKAEGGFWAPEVEELFPPGVDPREEWVYRLTLGMSLIAASFYPREVILRFSDFKTNEYATLVGAVHYELECPRCGRGLALKEHASCPVCGSPVKARKVELEPVEANPMMGWRGVSRYLDPRFKDAFLMEVEAMIRCHRKGLTNLVPMFPFVRHPEEAKAVTELVRRRFEEEGLRPPKMIFMAEVPSIGFVPYLFNPYCDGYSFGTNDYTQLITGTDRDSPFLPFNEDIPAVRMAIATVADAAHYENYVRFGVLGPAAGLIKPEEGYPKELGICGQAPSDLPGFLKFLAVYLDYVSVNPDAVMRTLEELKKAEEELKELCEACGRDPKRIALELSKEFELWDPFGKPAVSEFRARWLMAKLGIEPAP